MYCVVSVYDKRVKNYYQSMIWITFAPLTILLLKFFFIIIFYLFISFRLDDRTFSLSVWHASIHYVYHICASVSSLSLLFIVALLPSRSDILVCVLWHVSCNHYSCRLPKRLLICSIFLYHFRLSRFLCMRMCVFHYRSYFDHLCPVFQRWTMTFCRFVISDVMTYVAKTNGITHIRTGYPAWCLITFSFMYFEIITVIL